MSSQEKEHEKIKTAIRITQKRGTYLAVIDYKTNKLIGYQTEKERHIADGVSPELRLEALTAFDTFTTTVKLNAHKDSLSRWALRLPPTIKSYMNQAFEVAEKHGIEYQPSLSAIKALIKETTRVLKQVGIDPIDMPNIEELEQPKTPSKYVEGRKIFAYMLDNDLKGFKNIFDKIALKEFDKANVELQWLHNYKFGKSKPPMWAYASAIETLQALDIDIFSIGLDEKIIFDFWYSAHKDLLVKNAIIKKFSKIFRPNPKVEKAFENYVESRVSDN